MTEATLPTPSSTTEEYLGVLAGQAEASKPNTPSNTVEEYLDYLCDNQNSEKRVTELTDWNQELMAGSVTPNVTLPTPDANKVQSITYIFTAAATTATFTAPANWILADDNGTSGLTAGNSLALTGLTAGSIYECSFKTVSSTVIRMVMLETKTA